MRAKTGLFLAVCTLAVVFVASTAVAQAVYTDPVGFVKCDIVKNGLTMVSVPLNAGPAGSDMLKLNGPTGCIGDMIKENLTFGPAMGAADMIWRWDPASQKYVTAFYAGGLPPGFEYMEKKWFDPELGDLSTMTLKSGDAFFLQRVNMGADLVTITFLGWVPTEPVTRVTLVKGLTMFTFPYPAFPVDPTPATPFTVNDSDLGKIALGGIALGAADAVFKWDTGTQKYSVAFYAQGLGPGFEQFENKWFDPDAFDVSNIAFELGGAIWYMRVAATAAEWVCTRPYSLD